MMVQEAAEHTIPPEPLTSACPSRQSSYPLTWCPCLWLDKFTLKLFIWGVGERPYANEYPVSSLRHSKHALSGSIAWGALNTVS